MQVASYIGDFMISLILLRYHNILPGHGISRSYCAFIKRQAMMTGTGKSAAVYTYTHK